MNRLRSMARALQRADEAFGTAMRERDTVRRDIGAALYTKRHERGLGLRECARSLGVSAQFLCDIEHGRRWSQSTVDAAISLFEEAPHA